jgi:hypothetical protein
MAKRPKAGVIAADLMVRERIPAVLHRQWGPTGQRAGETVTAMVVKGLIVRAALGRLTLTDRGRPALRALL